MGTKVVGFNYDKVDVKDREAVEGHAREIKSLLERTARNIIDVGERLVKVKEQLPCGMFTGWLYAEFRWSTSWATRLMQAANRFGELDCLDRFQVTALLNLAQNNTDERAVEEAISRARSGEPISGVIAKDLIHRYRPKGEPKASERRMDAIRASLNQYTSAMTGDERLAVADLLERYAKRLRGETTHAGGFAKGQNGKQKQPALEAGLAGGAA